MPRYDDRDRSGNTRLYVGRLSSRTRTRDLEDLFNRYGRVRDVDLKHDFAFIEFSDPRDADEARYYLNGRDLDGSRIVVEFARGGPRGAGRTREYLGRGPPPGSGRCFNCGNDGHWARDCKAGDWKNKCYRCGERGHIERNCQNSPKSTRRERSISRSRSRSLSHRRGRSRSGSYNSRSRSYSRSPRSPRTDGRSAVQEERRSRSRSYSHSPRRARRQSPEIDSPRRARRQSPEIDSPRRARRQSPEIDSPRRARRQSPEIDGRRSSSHSADNASGQRGNRYSPKRNSRRSDSPALDTDRASRDIASPQRDTPGRSQSPAANGKPSHDVSPVAMKNQSPSPIRDSSAFRESPGTSS